MFVTNAYTEFHDHQTNSLVPDTGAQTDARMARQSRHKALIFTSTRRLKMIRKTSRPILTYNLGV